VDLAGKVAVVTGGASGLGAALCRRFASAGAAVAVIDLDQARCDTAAAEVGGLGVPTDVTDGAAVEAAARLVERSLGPIDLWCSNAGVGGGLIDGPLQDWQRSWDVHVMASVHAARAVLPGMLERGHGYLVGTASGAALTAEPGSPAYSATKHAMLDLYEVLAITYGQRGIKVSCFCPYGMLTPMLLGAADPSDVDASTAVGLQGAVTAEAAAEAVAAGIADERFLILSHPEALTYFRRKADDYDRWIRGMQRIYGTEPAAS
jgi:NAD(P)-dependent dehydrogenase (short-subunit alcohol dehydrogenase family)